MPRFPGLIEEIVIGKPSMVRMNPGVVRPAKRVAATKVDGCATARR
jgi:hypothetical protein